MTQKISNLKEIADKYSNFFFDLDGVIVDVLLFSGANLKRYKVESTPLIFFVIAKAIFISSPTAAPGIGRC
jgi:hypothetical protein